MSNLYMTTEEFAEMIVDALNEQGYFAKGTKYHPEDISAAFYSVTESMAYALSWAILKEKQVKKSNLALPIDDEIAPLVNDDSLGYSEWRSKSAYL